MVGIFFFATRSWGWALAPGPPLAPGSRLRLALFVRRRCGAIPDNTHAWLLFSPLLSPFLFFSLSLLSLYSLGAVGVLRRTAGARGGEILLFGQKMALLLACEIKNCYFCGYGR